jgi:hypothetical protein
MTLLEENKILSEEYETLYTLPFAQDSFVLFFPPSMMRRDAKHFTLIDGMNPIKSSPSLF